MQKARALIDYHNSLVALLGRGRALQASVVHDFIGEVLDASASVSIVEDRNDLRDALRYWAAYLASTGLEIPNFDMDGQGGTPLSYETKNNHNNDTNSTEPKIAVISAGMADTFSDIVSKYYSILHNGVIQTSAIVIAVLFVILKTIWYMLSLPYQLYILAAYSGTYRSPLDIQRSLKVPVIGHIPMIISEEESRKLEGAINGPDPTLVTYYRPKSRKAEVFRGIRTAIYFSNRGEGNKVIQITSPNMGDGKTTLASNLATSIAQSGKQTILIDGDFRRPSLHKIFAVSSEKGFASVLMGQCELGDAIQPTIIPGLSLLPCGPLPPNPAELLTSPRFKELMDELREQYDYVLIDTPPLLVVTDPCVVAPRVDGVLLAIRLNRNGRPIAERARDILASLGAKTIGIVVNGVSMNLGAGYGLGNYASSKPYDYQYKYDYSDRYYAGYGDEGYYLDRDANDPPPLEEDAKESRLQDSEKSDSRGRVRGPGSLR